MNTQTTKGIILHRTNYGEADRILIVLTDTAGVQHILAKGVRKVRSKMAGGIELFAVNELTYVVGRSELRTLVSSRMLSGNSTIVADINRTMRGYEFLKFLFKNLEHEAERGYFELLRYALEGLASPTTDISVTTYWFYLHFLALGGLQPDLHHDVNDAPLLADGQYEYDYEQGRLTPQPNGRIGSDHIKFTRYALGHTLAATARVKVDEEQLAVCWRFIGHLQQAR